MVGKSTQVWMCMILNCCKYALNGLYKLPGTDISFCIISFNTNGNQMSVLEPELPMCEPEP
jgi:hypothetical protein